MTLFLTFFFKFNYVDLFKFYFFKSAIQFFKQNKLIKTISFKYILKLLLHIHTCKKVRHESLINNKKNVFHPSSLEEFPLIDYVTIYKTINMYYI